MERFNSDDAYNRAMDRLYTTDAILALNPVFGREYLSTLNLDALHDLEDSLLECQYESIRVEMAPGMVEGRLDKDGEV